MHSLTFDQDQWISKAGKSTIFIFSNLKCKVSKYSSSEKLIIECCVWGNDCKKINIVISKTLNSILANRARNVKKTRNFVYPNLRMYVSD